MAKITLRKAGQIRNATEKHIRELEGKADSRVDINIYDPDPLATLIEERELVLDRARKADRLDRFVAGLRSAIGTANVESGIDRLLADRAALERRVSRLDRLTDDKEAVKPDTLVRQLAGRREKGGEEEGRGFWGCRAVAETLEAESLGGAEIDRLRGELAATRRELADAREELLRLNLEHEIEVPDEDLDWLRGENVI